MNKLLLVSLVLFVLLVLIIGILQLRIAFYIWYRNRLRRENTRLRAILCWTHVDELRSEVASTVTLVWDNDDPPPAAGVICCAEWTNWEDEYFWSDKDILDALHQAVLKLRAWKTTNERNNLPKS